MKSLKVLFLLSLALVLAGPAFALSCKEGNTLGIDECWTDVMVSPLETTPVIPGVVLEYSMTTDTDEENAYTVTVANASADYSRIAGVAQTNIATGDWGRVMTRGKGKVRKAAGVVSSGDYLYASATAGSVGVVAATGAEATAVAVESATNGVATMDALITIT